MPTTLAPLLLEGTTAFYDLVLVDEDGLPLELASLTALTLSYYDATTEVILNSRDNQDVLNANDVTVTSIPAAGEEPEQTLVTWALQPEDTVIVSAWKDVEYHTVVVRWTWDSGTQTNAHEVIIGVQHLAHAPV